MEQETIKKIDNIELVKYSNGRFGVIDHGTKNESGPRYRSECMAESVFDTWVREDRKYNA